MAGLIAVASAGVDQAQEQPQSASAPARSAPQQDAPQSSPATPAPKAAAPVQNPPAAALKPAQQPSAGDRRRAAKLFLAATKLFEKEQFEAAMQDFDRAASLDPSNDDYRLASEVARSHAVTTLIQSAASARNHGDEAGALAALQRAMELDPKNEQIADHLRQLSDDALPGGEKPRNEPAVAEG